MGNLATLLTIALVCAAFGFVAGSMLTSIWIDRHSKPSRSKLKPSEKEGKDFARIILNSDGEPINLEIDGEIYSSSRKPDNMILEKLKKTGELFSQWIQKDDRGLVKKEMDGKAEKIVKTKPSSKEAANTTEDHDMLFEINNIIQEKLKGSSVFNKIRLAREGTTGVSFWVDETSYKTREDIPDAQVRDLIKGAVAEWESHVR